MDTVSAEKQQLGADGEKDPARIGGEDGKADEESGSADPKKQNKRRNTKRSAAAPFDLRGTGYDHTRKSGGSYCEAIRKNKAAAKAEQEKMEKELARTRENLEKALKREKEKDAQIDLLKAQAEETEEKEEERESPEVAALREKVEQLERELRAADPAFAKFGALLEQYQAMFYDLIDIANGADDPQNRAKMREILTRVQVSFTAELSEE